MAFDLSTAKPVGPAGSSPGEPPPAQPTSGAPAATNGGGFDLSTARPVDQPAGSFDLATAKPVQSSFWDGFGTGSGGWVGLLKAPFTESIPAELIKAGAPRDVDEAVNDVATLGLSSSIRVLGKIEDFLSSDNSDKTLPQRMRDTFHAISEKAQSSEGRGELAGAMVKGLAADPELFFVPGMGEARAAATATRVAKAAGASERVADVTATVAGKAAGAGTGAALGGGTTALSEMDEGRPFDEGEVGLSALIGAGAGAAIPSALHAATNLRAMTTEEVTRAITPALEREGAPKATIEPTAGGYTVRMEGTTEGAKTFLTKAEAEAAKKDLEETASAYRAVGTVPRGTSGRARMLGYLHENPFTPENMARWIKWGGQAPKEAGNALLNFLKKATIPAAIGAGVGYWLDKDDPLGASVGAAITLLPRALKRDDRTSIEQVINVRNGLLSVMARHTLQFKAAIEAQVPEAARRTAIAMHLEGTPGVTLNERELHVAQQVRTLYDAMGRTAVDAGVLKELLANYVTHIVEEDPEAMTAKKRGLLNSLIDVITGADERERTPGAPGGKQFTQARKYKDFGELHEALKRSNLKVKTTDISELISIYSMAMFKTITDRRMLDALKKVPVDGMPPFVIPKERAEAPRPTPGKGVDIIIEGEKTGEREVPKQLPGAGGKGRPPTIPGGEGVGFKLPDEPAPGIAAQKFAARQRMLLQGIDQADSGYGVMPNRQLLGYVVHKDIIPQLNFVFNARDPMDVMVHMMALNQASKRAIVAFSMFHANQLYQAFVGAMGPLKAGTPLGAFKKARGAAAQYKYGINTEIDELLMQGLKIQPPEDMRPTAAQSALRKISAAVDKFLPVTGGTAQGARAIAAFNDKLDHFTFGTLQTGFKIITGLDAFERLLAKGVGREDAARMASSYANDLFGSLDWFRVANDVGSRLGRDVAYGFFNPNGRRVLQLLVFAPDWTISTFRAAYKALPGAVDDKALTALHRRYLLKSALLYLTIGNAVNLYTAGHAIFNNENPTRIQLKDGRTMQFSKHFMEPFEWLRDPGQTLANKLAFLPREAIQQLTGKEYVSTHDSAPDIENRAKHLVEQFTPIPTQQYLGGGEAVGGFLGFPVYGKTGEQKAEQARERKLKELAKKKRAALYRQRVNAQ